MQAGPDPVGRGPPRTTVHGPGNKAGHHPQDVLTGDTVSLRRCPLQNASDKPKVGERIFIKKKIKLTSSLKRCWGDESPPEGQLKTGGNEDAWPQRQCRTCTTTPGRGGKRTQPGGGRSLNKVCRSPCGQREVLFIFTEIHLIYNVVLISSVQQNDSYI